MKHSGKVRTLEGNEEHIEKINSLIDEMYEYMPAQQCVSQIRQHYIKAKKYFVDEATYPGIIRSVETNYGKITAVSTIKGFATNKASMNEALQEIGMYDNFEENLEDYVKNFLRVETTAIKLDAGVIANLKKLNEVLDFNIERCTMNCDDLTDYEQILFKLVASRANILKDINRDRKKYMRAVGKLRETFTEITNSKDPVQFKLSNFPTTYFYRGVGLMWDSMIYKLPYPATINLFLTEYDYKHSTTFLDKYKNAQHEIAKRQKKYFIIFLLDNIDYLDEREYKNEYC